MWPMKNRTDACMVTVFKEIYEYMKERNCKPNLHVMDNECSRAVQTFVKEQKVPIKIVEQGNHRVNAAGMGVKTGKYHLISSLATVAKSSPIQLWCQYMPQIEMTLNMLRTCRQDPTISAYKALNGPFDYNKAPLAPLGSPEVLYRVFGDDWRWNIAIPTPLPHSDLRTLFFWHALDVTYI